MESDWPKRAKWNTCIGFPFTGEGFVSRPKRRLTSFEQCCKHGNPRGPFVNIMLSLRYPSNFQTLNEHHFHTSIQIGFPLINEPCSCAIAADATSPVLNSTQFSELCVPEWHHPLDFANSFANLV